MKVIIAGSRSVEDEKHLFYALKDTKFEITEVVCGMARGADMLGFNYAACMGKDLAKFPANWKEYGKYAGIKRNKEMGYYADALIALWDGKSNGTKHMIDFMKQLNKPVEVYLIND